MVGGVRPKNRREGQGEFAGAYPGACEFAGVLVQIQVNLQ